MKSFLHLQCFWCIVCRSFYTPLKGHGVKVLKTWKKTLKQWILLLLLKFLFHDSGQCKKPQWSRSSAGNITADEISPQTIFLLLFDNTDWIIFFSCNLKYPVARAFLCRIGSRVYILGFFRGSLVFWHLWFCPSPLLLCEDRLEQKQLAIFTYVNL